MRMREQIQRLMIESINLSSTIIVNVARNVLTLKKQSHRFVWMDVICFIVFKFIYLKKVVINQDGSPHFVDQRKESKDQKCW